MFLSGHACASLVSRFMSFVPSRSTLNTLSDFVPSRSDSFFCATCASLQIPQQILVAAFMGAGQWEWLYKLCSHIGFFRCLSCHSSLSCCHFPLLGALARRIQDQSSAYICLKPDKCGSKLHAERFKSVSVAIPFGTWNQTLSVHVGLALGHRTHGYRSGSRSTSSLLKVALRTNNAARRGAVKSTWQCSARDTQHGTFENMKVNATSFHPRPHGPRSPRLFESTKHCLDSFYVGRPGHQMRNRVNTMWTRFQLKLSKKCIRFMWPSKATLSTESVLCEIKLVFSYIIEGSLEVKLPTIWTDEKQSREEAERRGRLEKRRVEEKE